MDSTSSSLLNMVQITAKTILYVLYLCGVMVLLYYIMSNFIQWVLITNYNHNNHKGKSLPNTGEMSKPIGKESNLSETHGIKIIKNTINECPENAFTRSKLDLTSSETLSDYIIYIRSGPSTMSKQQALDSANAINKGATFQFCVGVVATSKSNQHYELCFQFPWVIKEKPEAKGAQITVNISTELLKPIQALPTLPHSQTEYDNNNDDVIVIGRNLTINIAILAIFKQLSRMGDCDKPTIDFVGNYIPKARIQDYINAINSKYPNLCMGSYKGTLDKNSMNTYKLLNNINGSVDTQNTPYQVIVATQYLHDIRSTVGVSSTSDNACVVDYNPSVAYPKYVTAYVDTMVLMGKLISIYNQQ